MSLLVSNNDLIPIVVYYTVTPNKYGIKIVNVLEDEKAKELLADPEKAKNIKMLTTKWKQISWLAQNDLLDHATFYDPTKEGATSFNNSKYNQQLLINCLVDWDLTDDNGRVYPVTEENINQLHVSVAYALLGRYNRVASPDADATGE